MIAAVLGPEEFPRTLWAVRNHLIQSLLIDGDAIKAAAKHLRQGWNQRQLSVEINPEPRVF